MFTDRIVSTKIGKKFLIIIEFINRIYIDD
jgi:hypothetical protein